MKKNEIISNAVVCVYKDKKSNIYTAPLIFDNEECALRHFDNLSYKDINVCDYDLYLIGFYNNQFGEIDPLGDNNKYLLRSGDEYYDFVCKVKKSNLELDEIKKQYKNTIDSMIKFVKEKFINDDNFEFVKEFQDWMTNKSVGGNFNE